MEKEPLIRKVRQYIEKNQLLPPFQGKIIVGLSGGADSVVLLYILQRLNYECLAAHCNFHLRGEESLRDEKHAACFAQSLHVPFFKQSFDTQLIAKERRVSVEMAARDLRYEWFEQLRREQNAEAIAVAHHRDDCIETLLLNLIRGTGIRGLTGIKARNGSLIRPLLELSKQEILAFAGEKKLPYVTDSSNLQDEYTRNKIRLSVLPLLKSLNPSIDTTLLTVMNNLNEVSAIYEHHIHEAIDKVFDREKGTIDLVSLKNLPSPEAVLFELLKEYGFGSETIQDIVLAMHKQSGKEFHALQYCLVTDRNRFLLIPRKQNDSFSVLEIGKRDLQLEIVDEHFKISKDKHIACFDADKLQFPLKIRKWQTGDKFMPFGMNHFQKLSDYFSTHKFSKPEKEAVRLLCSGNDILWIIGHRTDQRYRIMEDTRTAAVIHAADIKF